MALEHLGFHVASQDLGIELIEDQLVQVAGQIDFEHKEVWLSTRVTRDEQFFTAAHELGHAVLHPGQNGLHRDRPLKGPAARKDSKEAEADYFASCFLMPRKQVVKRFTYRCAAKKMGQVHIGPSSTTSRRSAWPANATCSRATSRC